MMNRPDPAPPELDFREVESLPAWAPCDRLLESMLARRAMALLLFKEGACVFASAGARDLLGYEDGLLGATLSQLLPHAPGTDVVDPGTGADPRNFGALLRADGTFLSTEIWLEPVSGTDGDAQALMFRLATASRTASIDSLAHLTILDTSPDPIFVKDREGRYVYRNPAGCQMLRLPLAAVIGRTDVELYGQKKGASLRENDLQVIDSNAPDMRTEHFQLHGEDRWFMTVKSPWRDAAGNVVGVVGIAREITQRREAQRKLKEERDRARNYFDAAEIILIALDTEGRVTDINQKGLEILDYPKSEVVGQHWFENFLPPNLKERMRADFDEVVRCKRPVRGYEENCVLNARGETPLIAWRSHALTDETGRVISILSSGVDITQQRRMEESLKRSEQRFRDYAAASSDYFWEMDRNLRFSWFSGRFTEVTGVNQQELLGKTREEAGKPPGTTMEIWEKHLSDLRNRRPFRDFIHARDLSGGRRVWLSINGRPNYDDNGEFLGYRGAGTDITHFIQAQEAQAESEERYRKIFDAESAAITLIDADTYRIIDANDAALKMFGYSRDEFLELSVLDTTAEPDATREAIDLICSGDLRHIPRRIRKRKNGSIFPCELHASVLAIRHKRVACVVTRDLSEQEDRERALKESELRFQAFANNTPARIYVTDMEGRYTLVNSTLAEGLGKTPDDLVGKLVEELFPPEYAAAARAHRIQVLEKRETVIHESVENSVGGTRTYLSAKFPLLNAAEEIVGIGGFDQDISQLAEARHAFMESEERFRSFAESIDAEMHIKDLQGRYTLVNLRMAEFMGMDPKDLVGRCAADIYPPEIVAAIEKHDAEVIKTQKQVNREAEETWPDGTYSVFISKFPIFDNDGKLVAIGGLEQDITELARTRRALQDSEQRFKDFAEAAADYFWETDAEDRFTYLSENFERVRMMPREALLGKTRHEAIPQDIDDDGSWTDYWAALKARKPFSLQIVRQRPDGSVARLLTTGKPVFDQTGEFRGYRGATRDVTDAHLMSERLTYQATHDTLTGLVNRNAFEELLGRVINSAQIDNSEHALCYLDLDQFKLINDTCGHIAGDELLRQLCVQLKAKIRKRDTLARLGGDEFAILMEHCGLDQASRIAENLRSMVSDFRFVWEDSSFNVGVSIGLVPITAASKSTATTLSAADAACYVAKDQGRNRVYISKEDDKELDQRYRQMEWVVRINGALIENRLKLFTLPVVPITGNLAEGHHYEVLLRMYDEAGNAIPPAKFMPAAERYNLSTTLDRWVVRSTLRWLREHPEHVENLHICSINLTGQSIIDEEFLEFVNWELEDNRIPATKLCFEIAESVATVNLSGATAFIESVRTRGGHFALDDFGSGLSSLSYLKALPVDFLKIDAVFVRDMANNPLDASMVKSINEIGHVMEKKTIAEFVDNAATLDALRELGVDYAQGNAVGPLKPLEDLE